MLKARMEKLGVGVCVQEIAGVKEHELPRRTTKFGCTKGSRCRGIDDQNSRMKYSEEWRTFIIAIKYAQSITSNRTIQHHNA